MHRESRFRYLHPTAAAVGLLAAVLCPAASGAGTLIPTTTGMASDPNPSTVGAKVTLTATVAPDSATGTVEFFDAAISLGTAPLAGGAATLSLTTLAVGGHALWARYGGDSLHQGSDSDTVSHTVTKRSTATALGASPAKSECGGKVTLTATVTPPGATGTVRFFDGGNPLGTASLDAGGSAALSVTGLATGGHDLSAAYEGDAEHAASASPGVAHQVNAVATAVQLDAPPASNCSESVTLTATVTPAGATGSVEFFDGAVSLGTRPLTPGGTATAVVSGLGVGSHSLTAKYGGAGCHGASVSPAVAHEVGAVATTILLEAAAKSSCGGDVTLTATVTPAGGGGMVEFFDGATSVAVQPLGPGGVATATATGLAVGMHTLTATYHGDGCYRSSQSAGLSHQVNAVPSATRLEVTPAKTRCGETVTFRIEVTPAGATGTVEIRDGGVTIASRPLDPSGVVVVSLAGLSPGTHPLTARYGGDACHPASASDTVGHVVNPLPTAVALDVAPGKTGCGEKLTLTATLTPATVSGTVRFLDGPNAVGPDVNVSNGTAQLSVSGLAVGAYALVARFLGQGCDAASVSDTVPHSVNLVASVTGLFVDPNPAKHGTEVTLRATVSPSGATGTVEFFDGGVSLGTRPIAAGTAVLATSGLAVGSHPLTAAYGGDSCVAASGSETVVLEVVADGPPRVRVVRPNGGDTLVVGSTVTLEWTATDDNPVASVDLRLSRDNGSRYETLAAGAPNTGTFSWTVTPPGTNAGAQPVFSALFEVTARDGAGNVGIDVSDAPFAIHDPSVLSAPARDAVRLALAPVTPNPGRGPMRIEFSLARRSRVRLAVLDLQGREVARLADGVLESGRHQAAWAGPGGAEAPAGLYFVRLLAEGRSLIRRVVVTR